MRSNTVCNAQKAWCAALGGIHRSIACTLAGLTFGPAAAAADLDYLRGLLASTPAGGWVKASTNLYSDAWASEAEGGVSASAFATYSNPAAVVTSWSSVAWDPNRSNLLLWGGGHAAYAGNEMYVWRGGDGTWTRGSLPSRKYFAGNDTYFVVDSLAPQSAHTYDNNVFLPINDRFLSFGGAIFGTGNAWQTPDASGNPTLAGPWVWDPNKADPNKVGGSTSSGYLASSEGGEMWSNRVGSYTGTFGGSSIDGTSAYRVENGRDVVYLTRDSNASGFPFLYRYEPGDVETGELDRWDVVARSRNASSSQSAAAIDSHNDLYVRISNRANAYDFGLGVWDLNRTNASDPMSTIDTFVELVLADGTRFETTREFGIAFDEVNGRFVLWDGRDRGTVYHTTPELAADGSVMSTWLVEPVSSTTAEQPNGNFLNGVLGKWLYVAELGAFIALDEYQPSTSDAAVWLYKPFTAPIPEPGSALMLLTGTMALVFLRRRQQQGNQGR